MKWKTGKVGPIKVPEQEYQNSGTELMFKVTVQENFPEINHILILLSERVHLVKLT